MKVRIDDGREWLQDLKAVLRRMRKLSAACSTDTEKVQFHADYANLSYTISELANICAESRIAGGDVWYVVEVYVSRKGITFQVEKHGSVVGKEEVPVKGLESTGIPLEDLPLLGGGNRPPRPIAPHPILAVSGASKRVKRRRIVHAHILVMLRIGYHVSIAQSMDLAFDRASAIGCTCMQIFPSNPRGWAVKSLAEGEAEAFVAKSRDFDIRPVFMHMTYLPNLASPDDRIYGMAKAALKSAIARCNELGVEHMVVHLGSHRGAGKKIGMERFSEAINGAERAGKVTFLLENEAGQPNGIGSELDDLAEVYGMISAEKGFCLDTCHAFAAGYDVGDDDVVDRIGSVLGIGNIKLVHMNDSKYGLGEHRDRHDNIGFGKIGADGLRTFFSHKGMASKPAILETPPDGKMGCEKELALARSIIEGSRD